MSVTLQIDGRSVTAPEGTTILEAARSAGIDIPTLCHHETLAPFGACRMCVVEVGDRRQLAVSCVATVEEGQAVATRSERIDKHRKTLLELQFSHAPHAPQLRALAEEYGADPNRFEQEASFCIHCGLCVRYCAEVKQAHAIGFIDRGVRKEISFVPDIAAKECNACKACFPLCPTSYVQAAFVLVEQLAFPADAGGSR